MENKWKNPEKNLKKHYIFRLPAYRLLIFEKKENSDIYFFLSNRRVTKVLMPLPRRIPGPYVLARKSSARALLPKWNRFTFTLHQTWLRRFSPAQPS